MSAALSPSIQLAVVLELGEQREVFPVYDRSLLIGAAVELLRDRLDSAGRESDPEAAEAWKREALVLTRVFARLLPELHSDLMPAPSECSLIQ